MEVAAAVLLGIGAYEFFAKDDKNVSQSNIEANSSDKSSKSSASNLATRNDNNNKEASIEQRLALSDTNHSEAVEPVNPNPAPPEALKVLYEIPENLTDNEIVDQILDGSIPPLNYQDFDYTRIAGDAEAGTSKARAKAKAKNKEFVDETREIKDICTDMVVNLFLESSQSNFNFLKKVYETFENAINYYREEKELPPGSLILVYKGGNVLRIISNEFLRELPGSAAFDIQKYYQKFFKRSDADFSVYVDPNLPNYEKVYSDMVLLGFILQRRLRLDFLKDKTKYFDFFKYSEEFKREAMEPYFKKMRSMSSLTDPKNKTFNKKRITNLVFQEVKLPSGSADKNLEYKVQPDKGIQYANKDTIVRFEIPTDVNDNFIYVQSNETLDFEAAGKVKFALVRSKIDFNIFVADAINAENVLEVKGDTGSEGTSSSTFGTPSTSVPVMKSIGGELIDLSFPHKDDANLGHFYEHLNKYLHKYELHNGDTSIQFNSYALVYLVEDLEFILFKFVKKPWDAPKYDKRVNRLYYLYMIDIFNKVKTNADRREILESFNELFNALMNADYNDIDGIITEFQEQNREKHKHLLISNLVEYLKQIGNVITPVDLPGFRDFLTVLLQNNKVVMDSFQNIGDYCSIDGSIRLKNIYDGDLRSLV